LKSLDFKRGFDLRGAFFREAPGRFPKKRFKPSAVCRVFFRKCGFRKNDFSLFRAAGAKLCRGLFGFAEQNHLLK
jgi:hypothetical protein